MLPMTTTDTILAQHILIVDDDDHLRNIYSRALQKAGYEVHPAATLQEARNLLNFHNFDILLCDIQMGRNERGIDLLKEYDSTLVAQGTQIIMLSCEVQYRAMCEELGVEFFMEKPVALIPLVTLIDRLTARHVI